MGFSQGLEFFVLSVLKHCTIMVFVLNIAWKLLDGLHAAIAEGPFSVIFKSHLLT